MDNDNQKTVQGLSRKLADFTVRLDLKTLPQKVLDNAKIAILDCLGVAVLASSQEIGEVLLNFAHKNGSAGSCTVWGTRTTSSPRDTALLNGALAHGLDYDDRNHASTYTLAASMAAAESRNASGARALEAFIVGREVRMALDAVFSKRSTGIGPGAKGWHSNGILGPIASACSASKIWELDSHQTLTAIGLAAGSCGALTRDGGTMAKPFRAGHAAATGITCALLAREGFTGDERPLEGRYGLLEALGPLPDDVLGVLGKSLGSEFDLERSGVMIKPFSSCTATHAALEATLRLAQKHTVSPLDVDSIECDLKPYPLVRQHPKRGFEGRFSMPFCLAIALVHRQLKPGDFTNARVEEPLVQELMRRTHHTPGSDFVTVLLKGGTRLTESIQPATDLHGWDQASQKFNDSVGGVLSDAKRMDVLESVSRLEKLSSVRLLTGALQAENLPNQNGVNND